MGAAIIRLGVFLLATIFVCATSSGIDRSNLYHVRPLVSKKGVILVREKNIQLTMGNWKSYVYIDVETILSSEPDMKISYLTTWCLRKMTWKEKDWCLRNVKLDDFNRKSMELKALIDTARQHASSIKSTPRPNYHPEESEFTYDHDIKVHMYDHRYAGKGEIHYVGIMHTFYEHTRTLNSLATKREALSYFNRSATKVNFDWTTLIFDSLIAVDHYAEIVKQLDRVLLFASQGKLHPDIMPLAHVVSAAEEYEAENRYTSKKFIISPSEMDYITLAKYATFEYEYDDDEGLKFTLSIPIVSSSNLTLYKVIPYPVPQIIGKNSVTVAAYIEPRANYLIDAPKENMCSELTIKDISSFCKIIDNDIICPLQHIKFTDYVKQITSCEITLLRESHYGIPPKTLFEDCDVRIIPHSSYWQNIQGNMWLYSLPSNETLYISCLDTAGSYDKSEKQFKGVGIFYLSGDCTARAQNLILAGSRDRRVKFSEGERWATSGLNISELAPELNNLEISIDLMPGTMKYNGYTLQNGFNLNELLKLMRERMQVQLIQHQVEQLQIATYLVLLFACVISLLHLFPETTSALLSWMDYHFCRCCQPNGETAVENTESTMTSFNRQPAPIPPSLTSLPSTPLPTPPPTPLPSYNVEAALRELERAYESSTSTHLMETPAPLYVEMCKFEPRPDMMESRI